MMGTSQALVVAEPKRATAPVVTVVSQADLGRRIAGPIRLGFGLVLVFGVGFGAWASTAPIAGGAVAPGVISPDGSRRTVQHLEGGIISRLHVRDGDVVKEGQPLLDLESIQPKATYETLLHQHRTLLATHARLVAEQFDRGSIEWPVELQAGRGGTELRAIVEGQRNLFETRREMHAARKRVLRQKVEQLREQINATQALVESAKLQHALLADELEGKEQLWQKRLLTKPDIRRVERAQAEMVGKRGEYLATIARIKEQIGETELQLLALDAERADEIATKFDQIRVELAGVKEKLFASEDILKRTVVVAPVNGAVVGLRFKTLGGVLKPGEPILDVVPADDILRIDARVSPNDIDVVQVGLSAQIHFSAYSDRNLPQISGVVRTVSADRLTSDDKTGQPYYLARVEVDREELKRIDAGIELIAGMPAEVLIVTGQRTMMEYLLQPFRDALRRSFREV